MGEHFADVEKNIPEACKWYEKAANQEHVESQFLLGFYYRFGDVGFPADIEKGRQWYMKAAKKGHVRAQRRLGDLYRNENNYAEAVKWYNKAVIKRDKLAMFHLARLHEAPPDYAFPGCDIDIAVSLYEELSTPSFNYKAAMVSLGLLYCDGEKVSRNEIEGKKLLEMALFPNGKLEIDDSLDIYDIWLAGSVYCTGRTNINNEPNLDDLNKGIELLDIVIADGFQGYPPDRLELVKRMRNFSDDRRNTCFRPATNATENNDDFIISGFCRPCLNKKVNSTDTVEDIIRSSLKIADEGNGIGAFLLLQGVLATLKEDGCPACTGIVQGVSDALSNL